MLTNTSGTVSQEYDYTAYGVPLHDPSTDTTGNLFTYTGREYHATSGLYFYRARFYDPATGSFTSADPIGLRGGLNSYSYVQNLPTHLVDPFGLKDNSGNPDDDPDGILRRLGDPSGRLRSGLDEASGDMGEITENTLEEGAGLLVGSRGTRTGVACLARLGQFLKRARLAHSLNIGTKIAKQIKKRGWTDKAIRKTVRSPYRTAPTRDTRHLSTGGRMNDSATAYINQDGSYVIVNDRTRDIVQVSNRLDPNWLSPF